MFLKTLATAGVLALAATATQAATVTFDPLGAAGITLLTPSSGIAGTDYVEQDISNTQGAAPELATGADTHEYLSILGGGSVTIDLGDVTAYSLYIGSLDSYNTIRFIGGPTYTGDDLLAVTGAAAHGVNSGDQTSPFTNGLFNFTFDGPVTGLVLSSTTNSLEVGGVPEPATWAAMLLGFGGIGAAMRNRRRQAVTTA